MGEHTIAVSTSTSHVTTGFSSCLLSGGNFWASFSSGLKSLLRRNHCASSFGELTNSWSSRPWGPSLWWNPPCAVSCLSTSSASSIPFWPFPTVYLIVLKWQGKGLEADGLIRIVCIASSHFKASWFVSVMLTAFSANVAFRDTGSLKELSISSPFSKLLMTLPRVKSSIFRAGTSGSTTRKIEFFFSKFAVALLINVETNCKVSLVG